MASAVSTGAGGCRPVPATACTGAGLLLHVPWLRTLRRELYGGEALAIQGFRHTFQKIEEMRLSQTNLMDLAGNAFSAFCVVPVVLATLVHYPWPEICITDDDGGWSSSASAADQVEDRGCTDISNGSTEDENMCQSPPPKARKLV